MPRSDFCQVGQYGYLCGDEFTREKAWKAVRDAAQATVGATFRESIPAEKIGIISGRSGFTVGEFVPARNEFSISVSWPRELGGLRERHGRSMCAPRRPNVKTTMAPNGGFGTEYAPQNMWDAFTTNELAVQFQTPEAARDWKQRDDNPAILRIVYKITGATRDSVKDASGVDSGAGAIVLVDVLGVRLSEGGQLLAERVRSR